jgi:hypothetical protein
MSMKPITNNLDDLFAAARSEEPVLSEESVRDLLGKRELMQQKSNPSFYSTKGFIMTSLIGFSAASIVAISMLASPDHAPAPVQLQNNQPKINQSQINQPAMASAIAPIGLKATDPKKSQPVKIEIQTTVDETESVDPIEPVKPVTPEKSALFAPKQVMAVKPIVAKEADLPSLGISRKSDGGIAFYMKQDKGTFYESIIPATTWGVMTNGRDNIPASEVPASSKLRPTLISDARGNRRMLIFSDEDSKTEMNHSFSNVKDSNGSSYEDKMMVSHFSKGPGSDTLNRGVVIITDTKHTVNTTVENGDTIRVVNKGKDLKHLNQNINQIVKELNLPIDPAQIADAMNAGALLEINNPDKKVTIKVAHDSNVSIHTDANGNVKQNVNVNIRMLKKAGSSKVKIGNVEINGIPMLDEASMHLAKLDELVPVLVRPATATTLNPQDNTEYDNGVIFWFENTPELDKALAEAAPPSAVENHAPTTNKFLSSAVIYPNPTPGQAVVRFSLSEPKSLSFTLHDILGKRIADLGASEYSTAGKYSRELSLGNIAPGIYLLVIASDKGEQQIERIVVSR